MKNKARKNIFKLFITTIMMYAVMACTALPAYAAGISNDKDSSGTAQVTAADFSGITNWINSVSDGVKTVAYAIAGLSVIALGIIFITGGGQALQKGKGMAIGILVGVAVLSFGTALVMSLGGQ